MTLKETRLKYNLSQEEAALICHVHFSNYNTAESKGNSRTAFFKWLLNMVMMAADGDKEKALKYAGEDL